MSVIFPTSHLSADLPSSGKAHVVMAAPARKAKEVRLLFTRDSRTEFVTVLDGLADILIYHQLPNGEAIALIAGDLPWNQKTIVVPGASEDIVLPAYPTPGMKRPVSMCIFDQHNDMICYELSGFKMTAGTALTFFPGAGTITRNKIVHKTDRKAIFAGGT